MIMPSSDTVLVDSGFFMALFDRRDQHHKAACEKQEWLEHFSVVVPWPILYETINTRLVRRPENVERFESLLRDSDTVLLDDCPYRSDAYEELLERAKEQRHAMSLVDAVIYAILADPEVRVNGILTFNNSDFKQICYERGIELL